LQQGRVTLEILLPEEILKAPLAMELVLGHLYQTASPDNLVQTYWDGKHPPVFGLEIVSDGGKIHFYISTVRKKFKNMWEAQLYAQYPGVQVLEAPDYTRLISAKPEEWGIWGCDFKHTDKDPLPIKTYVEYGLDKVQKEPEQVDPLANLIEFMGSIGKGEYLWLQFIIRMHKGEKYGGKRTAKGKQYTWIDEAKELVDEIRKATRESYTDPATGEERPGFPNPTKGQSEKIAAIERNVSKQGFDTGARGVYIAKPEKFNPVMITHMISLFKPFSSEGWNGIRGSAWHMRFDDYPWEIFASKVKASYSRKLVEAYRRRQFFYDPFAHGISQNEAMVLSTEELATVFHIPSHSVETPGLGRIQSATGEAPPNLPT
ncbi:MAG: hypothetical protein AAB555_01710, partial [Patescibacteria group bacterium]